MKKRMGNRIITLWLALVVVLAFGPVDGLVAQAGMGQDAAIFTDIKQHWARTHIAWAAEQGIAAGYEDGTFRPNARISEREFIALVFRAYPAFDVDAPEPGELWYEPYYEAAERLGWPVSDRAASKVFTRGDVARILAATRGQLLDTSEAVQYLLDNGLSQGRSSATVAGYEAAAPLTRAEAVTFLYNVKQVDGDAGGEEGRDEGREGDHQVAPAFELNGVAIGDEEKAVVAALGNPDRRDASTSGYTWYVYNRDYARFAQIGISNGRVVALYSNAGGWEHAGGIKPGAGYEAVAADAGVSAQQLQDADSFSYTKDDLQIHVYLDWHLDGAIEGMLVEKAGMDRSSSEPNRNELADAYEQQIFDLTNVFRLKIGAPVLTWHDQAATAARLHSADMAERGYFAHDNLEGQAPWDRMEAAGVPAYAVASENIAAGYPNAFRAHAGWINSAGHRENMLDPDLAMLGVGVIHDTDSEYKWYYTQNFFTPW